MIGHHDRTKGPFFLYAAYQAVHGPLEAPQRYLDQCTHVTEYMRHIFCGMVLALDDGVGNITRALRGSGLLDNTVIALTTDNVSLMTLRRHAFGWHADTLTLSCWIWRAGWSEWCRG